jgi:hypothetical protein
MRACMPACYSCIQRFYYRHAGMHTCELLTHTAVLLQLFYYRHAGMHTCVLLTGTAYVRMFMFVVPSSLSVARLNTVVKYSV